MQAREGERGRIKEDEKGRKKEEIEEGRGSCVEGRPDICGGEIGSTLMKERRRRREGEKTPSEEKDKGERKLCPG